LADGHVVAICYTDIFETTLSTFCLVTCFWNCYNWSMLFSSFFLIQFTIWHETSLFTFRRCYSWHRDLAENIYTYLRNIISYTQWKLIQPSTSCPHIFTRNWIASILSDFFIEWHWDARLSQHVSELNCLSQHSIITRKMKTYLKLPWKPQDCKLVCSNQTCVDLI
jgi:hypothetical protein